MAMIKCRECGKDISDQAEMCPHCGCSINSNKNSVGTNNSTDGFCLGGMITGICSFFIDFFGLVSLTGLVISIIGLTRAQGKNKTFAVVGIVCSGIELFLKFIQLVNM